MRKISKLESMFVGTPFETPAGLSSNLSMKSASKKTTRMLWPAYLGTYVKAKHGPLKDNKDTPIYA